MTSAGGGFSHATNIPLDRTAGDEYVITDTSVHLRALHPHCRLLIGLARPIRLRSHKQQSMVLVPMDTRREDPGNMLVSVDEPRVHVKLLETAGAVANLLVE